MDYLFATVLLLLGAKKTTQACSAPTFHGYLEGFHFFRFTQKNLLLIRPSVGL